MLECMLILQTPAARLTYNMPDQTDIIWPVSKLSNELQLDQLDSDVASRHKYASKMD